MAEQRILRDFRILQIWGATSSQTSFSRVLNNSIDGLGREMTTLGSGEGICWEIRAVEELRRVRRDTMVGGLLWLSSVAHFRAHALPSGAQARSLTQELKNHTTRADI